MTRFARGTGSKGSNEKRPEEATSWQEMKAAMVNKNKNVKPSPGVDVNEPEKEQDIPSAEEIQSVWADLVTESQSHKRKEGKKKKVNGEVSASNPVKKVKSPGSKDCNRELAAEIAAKDGTPKTKKRKKELMSESSENTVEAGVSCKKKKNEHTFTAPMESTETHVTDETNTKKKRKSKKQNTGSEELENDNSGPLKTSKKKSEEAGAMNKTGKQKKKKIAAMELGEHAPTKAVQEPREKKRRKEPLKASEVIINGKPVQVAPFDGFVVQAEDAARLRELRQSMKAKGIPEDERERAIKLERRRAEKALARLKKRVCFHCRGSGHNLSECPEVEEDQRATGICFKCGSTEHTHFQCKVTRGEDFRFAECFICKEQGHIAKQCPDNPRGLYPRGGACSSCGDVTHLKKDCPKYLAEKDEEAMTVATANNRALEALEEDLQVKPSPSNTKKKQNKHIKF